MARLVYAVPVVGIATRRFLEARLGNRFYQDRAFWNASLQGWAATYLGGTLNVNIRDSLTVLLAKQLAPSASSFLDLGCGGGTLALGLGPEVSDYWGVDISDVAIGKAKQNLAASMLLSQRQYTLEVSQIQDFTPTRQFDVIVFKEVLYYLSLRQVESSITHYRQFLKPGGLVLISLKEHELSRFVETVILKQLKYEHGILYQQKPRVPGWKTNRNPETPAFLVQGFRQLD